MLRGVFPAVMVLFAFSQISAERHPCSVALNASRSAENTCTPNVIAVYNSSSNKIMLCKSLNKSELTERLNCSGTFKEPITPKSLAKHRPKRSLDILKPGETHHDDHCKTRNSSLPSDDNYLIPCGFCTNTKRNDYNHFPEFSNHITCNPDEDPSFSYNGAVIGECVQKVKDQRILYWDGDADDAWKENIELSTQYDETFLVQNWKSRTIPTNSSCELQIMNNNI